MRGVQQPKGQRRVLASPILNASASFLAIVMALLSVYILLRGHNAPGGGFIGGLVGAGAVVVYAYAFGARHARRALRWHPIPLAGTGLVLALLSGLPALFGGLPYLTHLWSDIGALKLGTTYLFDLGVFLVVVGAVCAFFLMFADE